MKRFPKPVVVTSKCFEFDACRYNGQMIPNNFVQKLEPFVDFRPICPEVEIGLGIPRDPVRIVSKKGRRKLVQPSSGRDLTGLMNSFADTFIDTLKEVDGFILKSRSPSCGIKDAKEFSDAENESATGKGPGLFAGKVLEKFPGLPVEDEGRLRNFRIREHFLTRLYTHARFREVGEKGTARALVSFQTENKYLLMSYNQKEMRALGRIAANERKRPVQEVIAEYGEHLTHALANVSRRTSNINVLMHALGYFSDNLTAREKAYFLDILESYREEKTPLSAVLTVLESWIIKYEVEYLARQTFFRPYPAGLMDVGDSGKGRDL